MVISFCFFWLFRRKEPAKNQKKTTSVKKYQEIILTNEQSDILKIKTSKVEKKSLDYSLVVASTVFPAPSNVARVSSPINGRIIKKYKNDGDRVAKGDVVCELESLEFADLIADLIKAKSELGFQKSKLDRNIQLKEKGISTESRLEEIRADYERSVAAVAAAKARLRSVGVPETQIDQFNSNNIKYPILKILSPMSGIINGDLIVPGQAVTAYENMMTIVNLSKVQIRGYIAPEDLRLVGSGDKFIVYSKDDPDQFLEGNIGTINPSIDEMNKSITVNSIVATKREWPKPGQILRMEISTGTEEPVIGIPLEAIIYQGEEPYVFVKQSDLKYILRPVRIKKSTEKMAIIEEGLNPGEEIAVSNVFDLKALSQASGEGE
ncbi:MAG: efflux RND transporter periplasmic adaptor subunit [Ignavibacteriales bacterium]|nr:efflux RND transporter periplasmic adaptor subunit [Ignavibacteriales bacterium]